MSLFVDPSSHRVPLFLAACLAASWLMMMSGCQLPTPDPPIETDVNSPVVYQENIGGFQAGDHVAGIITLTVPETLITFKIGQVRLLVDSTSTTFYTVKPSDSVFSYALDTRSFTQGAHQLTLAVYEATPTQGTLNLLGMPRLIFVTSVVFDQTPPAPLENLSVKYDGSIRMEWKQTTTPTFKQYEISAVFKYPSHTDTCRKIIADRAATSWSFDCSSYSIGTSVSVYGAVNSGTRTSTTTSASTVVGYQMGLQKPAKSFWKHPTRSETYALIGDQSVAVLGQDGSTILRTGPVLPSGKIVFHPDGSKLYVHNYYAREISVYSTTDFSLMYPRSYLNGSDSVYSDLVAGPNGRIYLVGRNRILRTYSDLNGQLLNETQIPVPYSTYTAAVMTASVDGKYLYVTNTPNSICKINIAADVPVVERLSDLQSGGQITKMELTTDQQRLLVIHSGGSSVEIRNAGDLSTVDSLRLTIPANSSKSAGSSNTPVQFVQEGNALYVVSSHYFIEQFDLGTYRSVKSWCIIDVPHAIGLSSDGRSILIGNFYSTVPNLLLTR